MADMSVSGIASGVDWEGIAAKLLEKAKAPAYVMLNKRDNLDLKKGLFEEFQVVLQNLQTKLSPLKLTSNFKAKQIQIDRLDNNNSYKNVLNATVNADAEVNVYDLQVLKTATTQTQYSDAILKASDGKLKLDYLFSSSSPHTSIAGLKESSFYIASGSRKFKVDVKATDTLDTIASKINAMFAGKASGVKAEVLHDKLVLKSENSGLSKTTVNMPPSSSYVRGVNLSDQLDFNMDTSEGNGGTVVIKGENGKTYKSGVDFDVVNGSQIRWRGYEPMYAPAGHNYNVTYTATGQEVMKFTAVRGDSGTDDLNVLTFTPLSDTPAVPPTIMDSNGVVYSFGTDFKMVGSKVHWMANKPASGVDYAITYRPDAGQTMKLDIPRGNQDIITGSVYNDFAESTTTIKYGGMTFTEGADYDIIRTGTEASVKWRKESAWHAPAPGDTYKIFLKNSASGTVTEYASPITRQATDSFGLSSYGFDTTALGVTYGSFTQVAYDTYTGPFNNASMGGSLPDSLTLTWRSDDPLLLPPTTARTNVPNFGEKYTVEYTYNSSTFHLEDYGTGMLSALGLNKKGSGYFSEASDAEIILDGKKMTVSSNKLGAEYKNEIIKGMTIELKNVGHVSIDVSQDAEIAVKSMQEFITAYNDALNWINTRLTEKEVDESKKTNMKADDVRWKWGLLAGNSLLRNSKSSLRTLTSQNIYSSFTNRTSKSAVYGNMSQQGVVNSGSLVLKVGVRVANITVEPGDTLYTIANKINTPLNSSGGKTEAYELHYDPDGTKYPVPFVKASVEGNKLVIDAGTTRPITMSGSNAVLSALGVKQEYTSLSQIGIKLKSTGTISTQGKSGELEVDTGAFMDALTANADDVANFSVAFAESMQKYLDSMLKSSQKNIATGVTAAEGAVVREMNAIDTEIKSINNYLTAFNKRLEQKQQSLYKQFAAAEVSLAKMMQQGSWISSMTAQLQSQGSGQKSK